MNRGYRVQFNSAIGPYKGGLRLHPSVNLGIIKFLGFEQIFKNSLTGLPIGGGKGGSDFDPKGKSDREIMAFCQAFMTELYRHIGPDTDVPAGDIGTGAREIGYMFGQYKRIRNAFEGVLTGKGLTLRRLSGPHPGHRLRLAVLHQRHAEEERLRHGRQDRGHLRRGQRGHFTACEKAQEMGAKVVTMSDSTGWVYDAEGIDLDAIKEIKEVNRARLTEYKKYRPASGVPRGPGRVERQVRHRPALRHPERAAGGGRQAAGAERLHRRGRGRQHAHHHGGHQDPCRTPVCCLPPGKAANAGGVAHPPALEMTQNSERLSWSFEEVDAKLKGIMENIFKAADEAAEKYGHPKNYVVGANIAGFVKVADAMLAQGVL